MRPYFERMSSLGKPLTERQLAQSEENVRQIKEVEASIEEARTRLLAM